MVHDVIFVNFFVLGYVGMLPAEIIPFNCKNRPCLLFWFFLIITPFIHLDRKTLKSLPMGISDVYLGAGEKNQFLHLKKKFIK